MGLDTSHNAWHGPYSSFNKFRYTLANCIGINLDEYNGYEDVRTGEGGGKEISSIKHDIMPLLDHSDCDGELTVEESKLIVNGLYSILEGIKDKPEPYHGFIDNIKQFIRGCESAITLNEPVDFH